MRSLPRWTTLATTLAMALPPAIATTQADASEEDIFIFSHTADPEKCNLGNAVQTDLLTLATDGKAWEGKCVKLQGYWARNALYSRRRDPVQVRYPATNEKLKARRIGLYVPERFQKDIPEHPRRYTAVGIVGDCATLGEGVIMVMGYCHYTYGTYLAASQMLRN